MRRHLLTFLTLSAFTPGLMASEISRSSEQQGTALMSEAHPSDSLSSLPLTHKHFAQIAQDPQLGEVLRLLDARSTDPRLASAHALFSPNHILQRFAHRLRGTIDSHLSRSTEAPNEAEARLLSDFHASLVKLCIELWKLHYGRATGQEAKSLYAYDQSVINCALDWAASSDTQPPLALEREIYIWGLLTDEWFGYKRPLTEWEPSSILNHLKRTRSCLVASKNITEEDIQNFLDLMNRL